MLLLALWVLGVTFKIGGKLIHSLLVIALIIAIIKLLF